VAPLSLKSTKLQLPKYNTKQYQTKKTALKSRFFCLIFNG